MKKVHIESRRQSSNEAEEVIDATEKDSEATKLAKAKVTLLKVGLRKSLCVRIELRSDPVDITIGAFI